jgi:hypothetical protein
MAVVQDSMANRFETIPERNVFGLKPPPPKSESNAPPPQVPKIVLTGITTVLGNKRALMKLQPVGNKPNEQAKDNSLILTEGQREGAIEVIEIDEKAGSVKVNNSGTVMILTFEKDGAKLPNTPPPLVAAPGAPPLPGAIPAPLPNMTAAGLTNTPGVRTLPTRRFRTPTTQGTPASVPGQTTLTAPAAGQTAPPPLPPSAVPQDLTPEEQAILQQVQREAAGAPATPPVPGQPVYAQ